MTKAPVWQWRNGRIGRDEKDIAVLHICLLSIPEHIVGS